ncbi:stomatal closure-related actin-binding protein 1-like isoform X1 [Typha angustifolia]|uniref:stomatal closure-related actin-binding protein 1-like isoform X1 n=1 Tax=Typha angustifolia TaxID=59011 RepID=UPI003C2D6D14
MTRTTKANGDSKMQREAVRLVSSRINFYSNKFPSYKIGAESIIIEPKNDSEGQPLKEIVAKETTELLERRQRPSVRDLTRKFEKGLNTATWLSDEVSWRQVAFLERDVLIKKLRDILELLRAHVVGRNKDEVEESITMVESLAVQLSQREGELLRQKSEVKKLATSLKLASEDAKRIVEEERANAHKEIERAREAVHRVEQVIHEQEMLHGQAEKQDVQKFRTEVHEARRIKMLHYPSKVMDMDHEIQILRDQLKERCLNSIHLRKELAMTKKSEENKNNLYEFEGLESLGSSLHIVPRTSTTPDISKFSIQWYRMQPQGSKKEVITGATKSVYAPEPFDVGWFLQAEVILGDDIVRVTTTGPIDPAAGLGSYVEALVRKPETEFNVVIIQVNGNDQQSDSIHVLNVGRLRMKLTRGKGIIAKEFYSSSMQLCGARGGGNAAAQALFWRAKKGLHFTLAFESVRERNAAVMLARRFAIDCNIVLAGPCYKTPG